MRKQTPHAANPNPYPLLSVVSARSSKRKSIVELLTFGLLNFVLGETPLTQWGRCAIAKWQYSCTHSNPLSFLIFHFSPLALGDSPFDLCNHSNPLRPFRAALRSVACGAHASAGPVGRARPASLRQC